ncbi:cytidyltransferase-related enzyme [Synechococcus sp. PCC 7502]|uniref:D-glycero-beta-D-manno-heptose 1-phosphate adenylyltransferase n=1 Tax=Synechococcus sp. PCC 7502 TaxID=1173263 RepID=UPI00029FD0A9|nr:D-glycero-beta-D-manno-heptose 1-phosphate adenylyltransferase [Synechococcus sp. PCC 7502]AFY75375.1 cytidyltransferase-related enzyme [Synechococcus sp. PCC 7502]
MAKIIFELAEFVELLRRSPEAWRPLVFTNGCFDLIHVGHVRYLESAKALGKTLVVGLNSDRSVQELKGLSRPIIPEDQRAEVMAALKPVDAVIIFPEPTAIKTIEAIAPDIYAKGGDYTVETLPEAPTVNGYGGKISLIQIEVPSSTTKIVQRIKSL